jgi:hypothetical protein
MHDERPVDQMSLLHARQASLKLRDLCAEARTSNSEVLTKKFSPTLLKALLYTLDKPTQKKQSWNMWGPVFASQVGVAVP